MRPYVKKFLILLVCLSSLTASFIGGVYWHVDYDFEMDQLNFISATYVQAKSTELVIESLDRSDIVKARDILTSEHAVNILYLDHLMVYEKDEELKERSRDLFRRIAAHREKFPEYYAVSDKISNEMNDRISSVNKVLLKYRQ